MRNPACITRREYLRGGARKLEAICRDIGGRLCRRIESQVLDQLGVEVVFDSAPLGGRDLLARGATFRRLAGKEGGLSIADARAAAGI